MSCSKTILMLPFSVPTFLWSFFAYRDFSDDFSTPNHQTTSRSWKRTDQVYTGQSPMTFSY
eukprot:scaffold22578_cov164-Cylindrotheca_fusiformis.AAC.6